MYTSMTCPVCKSDAVVAVGPLTVQSPGVELYELPGEQCTLCGHLGVQIPQPWISQLYPDTIARMTLGRRERHKLRRERRVWPR